MDKKTYNDVEEEKRILKHTFNKGNGFLLLIKRFIRKVKNFIMQ